jgi:hypothetical protein
MSERDAGGSINAWGEGVGIAGLAQLNFSMPSARAETNFGLVLRLLMCMSRVLTRSGGGAAFESAS